MAKTKYSRTRSSNQFVADDSLSVEKYLAIPSNNDAGTGTFPSNLKLIRVNTNTLNFEVWNGTAWIQPGADMTAVNQAIADAINNLVHAAPGTLDTLKELADALGDDPNFAATITAALANVQTQVSALSSALVPHPTYTLPNVSLTSSQTTAGLEVGQTINIPIAIGFNQNDGGAEGAIILKKDGVQISTATPYTDNGVVLSLVAKVYQATVSYGQGPIKNNIIGVQDPTGRIAAGSAISNSLSYVGNLRVFFGATDTLIDASNIRTALGSVILSAGSTVNFQSGATYKNFYIWVATGHALTSWFDSATNADLKAASTNSSLTIPDAGSGTVAGTLYKVSAGSPFPGPNGDLFKFIVT